MATQNLLSRYSNRFVSRWLILAVDIAIVLFSFAIATLLRLNFNIQLIDAVILKKHFFFLLYIRLGCFFYFRSYTGIIRHSSIEDAILIFKAITLSSFLAGFASYTIRYVMEIETSYFVPFSILLIDYFICLFLMISSRFLVKAVYESLVSSFKITTDVLIYGAGYSGLITKNLLQNDNFKSYNIIGFIDDNPSLIDKTIEGIRVYSQQDAINKLLNRRPDYENVEVIVAIKKISSFAKRRISDVFLERALLLKLYHRLRNGLVENSL
ncbi:nucleoside-diphosphate sugar epimerase/dehydratase [Pseudarcicella hirudinis]|uniref:nucleoside-diphosphate sugar epimerase/dehydratase n=1 Tax=Pseudarcicella hirudinis TaxID=1079859 RepID=UPI0035E865D5